MLRLALGMFLLSCNVAHAQLLSSGVTSIFETSGGYSIPDPNDHLSVISLAKNDSVRQAIGLSAEQSKLLVEAFQANSGSFSSVAWGNAPPPDAETSQRRFNEIRAERARLLDELISPDQWETLRKIAYQVEIARIGLGKAITEGRLGRDVGVHENQKTHLLERVSQIEAATIAQIDKVRADSQRELLAELPAEVSTKIETLIGSPFPFREDTSVERKVNRELTRRNRLGISIATVPDPGQKLQLSSLLFNASVRRELKFRDSHFAPLVDIIRYSSRDGVEARLDELVSTEQWTHLRQLSYQIEIARFGLKEAVVHGRLGRNLELSEEARKHLIDKATAMEAQAGKRIVNIRKQAQNQLLAGLSSEQRAKAQELLGEPFHFENDVYWRYAG